MASLGKIVKYCKKIVQYAVLCKCHMISTADYNRKYGKYCELLFSALYQEKKQEHDVSPTQNSSEIIILTTPVLMYLAVCIQKALQECNIEVQIRDSYCPLHEKLLHIVLAPMCFAENLPPRYIAVQMEQSISERWFTPEYIETLNNAVAVMDYSAVNVENLRKRGIAPGRVFCVPVTPLPHMASAWPEKKTPILFYGDYKCERRKSALEQVSRSCEIKTLINVYRDEMSRELDKSAIVINIHYYEGAMLETTRIAEALSHNCLVVSESSINDAEYPELKQVVDFVPVGDFAAMAERLDFWKNHPEAMARRVKQNQQVVNLLYNRFAFDIGRVLFYSGVINFETLYRLGRDIAMPEEINLNFTEVAGSSSTAGNPVVIDHPDAEYSRASTYAFYARKALMEGRTRLIVEDASQHTVSYGARAMYTLAQWDGVCKGDLFEKLLTHIQNEVHE